MKVRLDPHGILPVAVQEGIIFYFPEPYELSPLTGCIINTGVHIQIPSGYTGHFTTPYRLKKMGVIADEWIDEWDDREIRINLFNGSRSRKLFFTNDELAIMNIIPTHRYSVEPI